MHVPDVRSSTLALLVAAHPVVEHFTAPTASCATIEEAQSYAKGKTEYGRENAYNVWSADSNTEREAQRQTERAETRLHVLMTVLHTNYMRMIGRQ